MASRRVLIELGVKVSAKGKAAVKGLGNTLTKLGNKAAMGLQVGAGLAAAGLAVSVNEARKFQKAMAEVSTIVDTTNVSMKSMNNTVLELSRETGKDATELAKGLYQAISAGAEAGAEANQLLAISTRAAIAGVADTAEAVNLLTNVSNAYGKEAASFARISDIAFKTVEQGKTTFSELASSMGQVLPFSSQLNISLEEIFAATATLTKGGLNTSEAVTALKGSLAAIIKPTADAAKFAKELGIDFTAAAVQSKGLAKFMQEVKIATGGESGALAKLFPNIRGLTAMLALTGKQAAEFKRIQEELTDSVGASGVAYRKVAETDAFELDKAINSINVDATKLGIETLPLVARALKFTSENLTLVKTGMKELNRNGNPTVGVFDKILSAAGVVRDNSPIGILADMAGEAVGKASAEAEGRASTAELFHSKDAQQRLRKEQLAGQQEQRNADDAKAQGFENALRQLTFMQTWLDNFKEGQDVLLTKRATEHDAVLLAWK